MDALIEALAGLPPLLVYLVLAAVVASETAVLAGVLVPTLSVLLFVGFLARTGEVDVRVALAVAVAAGIAGDHVGFWTGRRHGARLRGARAGRWISPQRWERADAVLARRGGGAVLVGRWLTVIRTLTPMLAGGSRLPYATFTACNAVGVLSWASAELLAGYAAGASYQAVAAHFGRATGALALLTGTLAALLLAGRWLGRHPEPVLAAGRALAAWPRTRGVGAACLEALDALRRRHGSRRAWALTVAAVTAVMVTAGVGLATATRLAVDVSGLDLLDGAAERWLLAHRDERLAGAAAALVGYVRLAFTVLVAAVAVVVVTAARRARRPGARPLPRVTEGAGIVLPLGVLGIVVDLSGPAQPDLTGLAGAHTAVFTATACLLAWLAARDATWARRVAAWTAAAAAVTLVAGAELYAGFSAPSRTLAAVLLGLFWNVTLVTAWTTRNRLRAQPVRRPGRHGVAGLDDAGTAV